MTAPVLGWALLALIFAGIFALLVASMATVEGFGTALFTVTAIFCGSALIVVLIHFAAHLIYS